MKTPDALTLEGDVACDLSLSGGEDMGTTGGLKTPTSCQMNGPMLFNTI